MTAILHEGLVGALQAGKSVRAIARETGLKHTALARFLRSEQSLRLDKADALAEYLGVEVRGPERKTEMPLNRAAWKKACGEYARKWEAGDGVLYDMCRKWPTHSHIGQVCAKVNIIGRSFGTGIERQVQTTGPGETARDRVAQLLYQHRHDLDELIGRLSDVVEPLTPETLRECVAAQGKLVRLLASITRSDKRANTPRTFAAKYLHCHVPAVPIFDNDSNRNLGSFLPNGRRQRVFRQPRGADGAYYSYVQGFWQLYQEARNLTPQATARLLDYYIWRGRPEREGA